MSNIPVRQDQQERNPRKIVVRRLGKSGAAAAPSHGVSN